MSDTIQNIPDIHDDLTHFQREALAVTARFAVGIGYIWLVWVLTPMSGKSIPANAWFGIGLLTIGGGISYLLRANRLLIARHLLVFSMLSAAFCAALTFPFSVIVYLFALPIVFASVLLSQQMFSSVVMAANLLILITGVSRLGVEAFLADTIVPLAVIALITIAAWLPVRNLRTALKWFQHEYRRAHHNALLANERQAELRRTLKSLDEAKEALERSNYLLTITRRQAEAARRLKQQFAQTISHELRTPLNLIVGFTELMIQSPERYGGQLPVGYLRDLSIVYRNACHLQDLVSDVLDLARIEAAQMSLVPEEVDPAILLKETVDTARSLVEAHDLELHTHVEPDLPRIMVDSTRIRQVLFNLLNNAVNWTDHGCITVSAGRQDKTVVFAVADTGVGIADKDIPYIFEEFRQLDMGTRRKQRGAGLGLAISKRFVELHGGRIWVESAVGQGSTFYFSLPVNQTLLDISITDIRNSAFLSGDAAPDAGDQQPVLLTVTRNLSAVSLLHRYIHGCRLVTAPDIEMGRRMARPLTPQVVIVDQTCTELEALAPEELARAWELPHSLFMVCSLPGEESLRQRLAVEGYLIKPITRQRLWDALRPLGERVDTVLVVDDDVDFVRMLSRMLNSSVRRYQVISAYSGQEALSIMSYREPDVILLDLFMPDLDGFQVIKRIRSTAAWQHIPIVVVSAQDEADDETVLNGAVSIAKADGLVPGELVQWVQNAVNMAARS
ncbi:MAG: response regulator [Anaerolineae bacterium]|nr:response regulator [Anaerolineae bacterium]